MVDERIHTFVAKTGEPFSLDAAREAGGRTGPGILEMSEEDLARIPPDELAALFTAEVPTGEPLPTLVDGARQPRILAEGDSWFAYPKKWILLGSPSNIILQLFELGGYRIRSLAANGDEAVEMLAGSERERLVDTLAASPYDALLFSGGGNDITGKYNIDYLVRRKSSGHSGAALVDPVRFQRRLNQIRHAYLDLLSLVERFSRNADIPIFAHTYDRAIPTGKGAKFVGGLISVKAWIKPYLDPLGIPVAEQQQIIDWMLDEFEAMLIQLEKAHPRRFFVIRTRPTVAADEWSDEIHPTPGGFRKLAIKVKAKLDKEI